ncbi:MAG TPA: VCBS repeat-containing protein, partial [Candidatus Kryptobacter bacterium]|nr:VCBS repeat-containing protein [Candidatus Kryptobacter bacterium]
MKFTLSRRSYSFVLLAALCVFGAQNSHGQQLYGDKTSSVRPGTGLNRIFSTNNTYGPLGAARKVASADNLMLFWSEPPSSAQQGTTPGDAFHFQFMTYLQGQPSLPSNQRLAINDSLVGDSVTDAGTGTKYPAIDGSKWSVALAGDMNGDGNAQAVAVWETANQQVFATAQPINKSNLSFQNSSVTGNLVGQVDPTPSQFDGLIHARLADLNGDGHHELVIAYDGASDGKVHIAVYGYSASSESHLSLIARTSDMSVFTSPAQYYQLIALATGDFNGNGHDDIAVAGFKNDGTLYIRLFSLNSGTTLVADGEKDLPTSSQPSSYNPLQLLMAAGDFAGNGSYGLVLAMNDGSNAAVYIASVDSALDTISVSFNSSYASFAVNQGAGISLDCGDLNATGKEQIVLGAQNEIFVLAAQPNGSYFLPVQKSNTYVTGASDNSDYLYSTSFIRVGDVDEDSHADVVVLRNFYNDNGTTALQEMVVNVLGSTDTSFDLSVKATIPAYMSEYTSDNPDWRRHFDLALCDINGGLKLGIPTHYYETNIVQPLVILNAPPVQFDVFNDTSYDICDVFNGGRNAGTFVTTYNQSTANTDMMETNVT